MSRMHASIRRWGVAWRTGGAALAAVTSLTLLCGGCPLTAVDGASGADAAALAALSHGASCPDGLYWVQREGSELAAAHLPDRGADLLWRTLSDDAAWFSGDGLYERAGGVWQRIDESPTTLDEALMLHDPRP